LITDRITVTPHVNGARKWVDFHGDLLLAPIVSGIMPALGDTIPDPTEGSWWPQGDHHTENDALILSLQGLVAA
jgi:hypothetical protein